MAKTIIQRAMAELGSRKSARKTAASKENGKRGGYWRQKRNLPKDCEKLKVNSV